LAKKSDDKKSLKLNIQNKQIAKAVNLKGIKEKLSKKKASEPKEAAPKKAPKAKTEQPQPEAEETPRIKARSKSAFSEEESVKESGAEAPKPAAKSEEPAAKEDKEKPKALEKERLGPTGKHIKDILPPKKPQKAEPFAPTLDSSGKNRKISLRSTRPRVWYSVEVAGTSTLLLFLL